MREAVAAAAEMARANQSTANSGTSSGNTNESASPGTESVFTTEACYTSRTYTNIYSVCFNVDVTTGPNQLEEANLTFMSKLQAIQNSHDCVEHIASERLQHLVENGQWLWTHASKPVNFARE